MASQPGPLTQWPWQKLGNFKYVLLAPLLAHSTFKFMVEKDGDMDLLNILIIPTLLLRLLHGQLWITISRFQTARSKHTIVNKSLDFEQVDRERNWDDPLVFTALMFYIVKPIVPVTSHLPWWNTMGVAMTILLHVGPVEFLYYWFHRALHHHFLYSRYHSHHHASIVTEPITAIVHPFAEMVAYFALFAVPLIIPVVTGKGSVSALMGYLIGIDFMNYMGHCNFELVPNRLFELFPPLKYLIYTPSFHSLHHTQFRTNYSLFMPFYDYLYGTVDESTTKLYQRVLRGKEETPHVVHLTHLTNLQSIYHLRLGFPSFASESYTAKWYLWFMSPLTYTLMLLMSSIGSTFVVERNRLSKLHTQTWAIPRFNFQFMSMLQREAINDLIEKAILEADRRGTKVMSLGLLNQEGALNGYGDLYVRKNPNLKIRIVDGTSLAVGVVLNGIPHGTREVLLIGKDSRMAYVLALTLCQRGIRVAMVEKDQYKLLKLKLPSEICNNLVFTDCYSSEVWLVDDGLKEEEQNIAPKGTHFIPFSQFPFKAVRRDCIYSSTPALTVPKIYENLHTCENWLPRRVMSAWRVAGILHALEGWDEHELGDKTVNICKVWHAAIGHGFVPYYPQLAILRKQEEDHKYV